MSRPCLFLLDEGKWREGEVHDVRETTSRLFYLFNPQFLNLEAFPP